MDDEESSQNTTFSDMQYIERQSSLILNSFIVWVLLEGEVTETIYYHSPTKGPEHLLYTQQQISLKYCFYVLHQLFSLDCMTIYYSQLSRASQKCNRATSVYTHFAILQILSDKLKTQNRMHIQKGTRITQNCVAFSTELSILLLLLKLIN